MPDKSKNGRTTTIPNFFKTYSTPNLPGDPDVTLIFGGLMGFFCKPDPLINPTQRTCEIGVHHGQQNKHQFDIRVFKAGSCDDITPTLPPGKIQTVTVEICRRTSSGVTCNRPGDVEFFEVGDSFSRVSGNPKDFRWLLDLDDDLFYPENRPKHPGQFKPKIIVRHGTFYTRIRTNSTFFRIHPPNDLTTNRFELGQVAYYMAADFKLNPDEFVSLKIDSVEVLQLPLAENEKYEIRFMNECFENGMKCNRDELSHNEEERNDFHFNRKVLNLPAGHNPTFGLLIKDELDKPVVDFCSNGLEGLINELAEVTDEAPCMGSGYGQTPGVP